MPSPLSQSKKRLLFWLVVLIDLALWVAAFSWRPSEIQSAPVVAVNIWPGTETLIAARESGRLPRRSINLVEMAWSSSAMRAFGNRAVDVAVLTLSEAQLLRELGQPFRVLMVMDESVGADALVGRPGIKQVEDLRGKKIGVEVRTVGHYLLARALEEAGMSLKDVQVVPLILPETETAFDDLGVDAVATAEPWLTRLVSRGGAVLYDSGKMPGEIQRILVAGEEVVERSPEAMRSLIDAHFKEIEMADWPEEILSGIHRREGLSAPEFADVFSRIRRFGREDQAGLLSGSSPRLRENLAKVFGNMERAGLFAEVPDQEVVIDTSVVTP